MASVVHLGGISLRKPGELGIVFILNTQILEDLPLEGNIKVSLKVLPCLLFSPLHL